MPVMLSMWRKIFSKPRSDQDSMECWIVALPVRGVLRPTTLFIGPTEKAVRRQVGRIFDESGEDEEAGWELAAAKGWRTQRAKLFLEGADAAR
jgi:hypothetical protein